MFQDVTLKPLLTEESYTLHGKEAQHFFTNKLYTAARRGDKFRELVQDVFENVRSTICGKMGYDSQSPTLDVLATLAHNLLDPRGHDSQWLREVLI